MSIPEPNILQITQPIIYDLAILTTKILIKKQNELEKIKWQDGEANTDTEFSKLACDCCKEAWSEIKNEYRNHIETKIICEIPDIKIKFIYPDGSESKHNIELKSSKKKIMPGSTIRKLDINQPVIYCLRPSTDKEPYKLKCSQYFSAMGECETDLFQDRTPRPDINFDKMNDVENIRPFERREKNDWVEHYANCSLKRIENSTICQNSWQDDMMKKIKKKIIDDYIRNTSVEQFQMEKNSLQTENTNIQEK